MEGMAPHSPSLPARCPSSPHNTLPGGCRGFPLGAGAQGCSHKCPTAGAGPQAGPIRPRAMEHFTGHLRLPFRSPCGAPWRPHCAIPAPLPLVGGYGVKGVSQDTEIGLDPTQRLALSMTSISAAQGHEEEEEAVTGMAWEQGEDEEGAGDVMVLRYFTPWGTSLGRRWPSPGLSHGMSAAGFICHLQHCPCYRPCQPGPPTHALLITFSISSKQLPGIAPASQAFPHTPPHRHQSLLSPLHISSTTSAILSPKAGQRLHAQRCTSGEQSIFPRGSRLRQVTSLPAPSQHIPIGKMLPAGLFAHKHFPLGA